MSAPRIRRLPPDVVNQIAAGEVIERPASVVKELVENAIDAEASRIEVALEEGGRRLIRVSDDGVGMGADDLPLAFASHATSKLATAEELAEVATLGFRGEALASIAAIARCRLVSRERGSDSGMEIRCEGGAVGDPRACGAPEGTLVEVRDLFYNVPARRKFLRSTPTELRHCVEAVTRLALPHPALSLRLSHDGRLVLNLDPCETLAERLKTLLGEAVGPRLLEVHSESAAMTLAGFVTPPGEGRTAPMQYVFLNGRYIRDRAIRRAVADAYRNRIPRGRHPAVLLHLQMDPRRVDVNVHPTKIEVRFRDPGAVFAQVFTALERALSRAGPAEGLPDEHGAGRRGERIRTAISDFFEGQARRDLRSMRPERSDARDKSDVSDRTGTSDRPGRPVSSGPPGELFASRPGRVASRARFQLHDAYIVEEVEGGFLIIDQHALHERIIYESLRARMARAGVPRQRLLVPEVVELRPQDFMKLIEMKEELLRVGVEIEPFGERTIAVQAVPHLVRGLSARELLQDFLREEESSPADATGERIDRIVRAVACKAAVKAGERLGREQIDSLLEQRDRLGPEPTCPHGRPTTLRFDLDELEKMFRRK